jgi:23S rRNA (uracil1939-C5)-methyltransferase
MSLVKNQDIQLNIEGYTAEGNGVGHYDGQAVFVSGAAKGDTIIAHIIKAKKTYAIGIIKQILKKSNDRIDVDCPHFRSCGGCAYRHISYEAEKALKKQK